jgi:hypothetical protein
MAVTNGSEVLLAVNYKSTTGKAHRDQKEMN